MFKIKNKLNISDRLKYKISQYNGVNIEANLKQYIKILNKIKQYSFSILTDQELRNITAGLKQKMTNGISIDYLLPETYAVVIEACKRSLKIQPFVEQIIAGIVLHYGKLAEMQTGEGKTLAAVFPAILNALTGNSILIMTANSYLAKRDALWMKPIYNFFDMNAGYIQENMNADERKNEYNKNITYLTVKEAGFDFLKDSLCNDRNNIIQKPFYYAIVDETDFTLIDEARLPLVIATNDQNNEIDFNSLVLIAESLICGTDYCFDMDTRNIFLLDQGIKKIEDKLHCGNLYDTGNHTLLCGINVTLQAFTFYRINVDYIIKDGIVKLIDEFTGRIALNRRLPHGIHNALEAQHRLNIEPEGFIRNSVTIQHFINLFPRIGAMTATAVGAADDFSGIYNLSIVIIPPHKPCIRRDIADSIFMTKKEKYNAIITEAIDEHKKGRPILVGTASIEESEYLSELFSQNGIQHTVLNAKNDEKEAFIIARAGELFAVTISTNMAGRGIDIRLGGLNKKDKDKIEKLGGLYIIGTTRFDNRRIDLQLIGRSGRQGDPGGAHFFISMEDDLIIKYKLTGFIDDKFCLEHITGNEIARAQRIIANRHYLIRKTLIRYSEITESQRKAVYNFRQNILFDIKANDEIFPADLLRLNCTGHYEKGILLIGECNLRSVEKEILLFCLDKFWADHLECIAMLKENLHLQLFSNNNPLYEFINEAGDIFLNGIEDLKTEIINTFMSLDFNNTNNIFKKEYRSESTFTYIIDDNSFVKLESMISIMKNASLF